MFIDFPDIFDIQILCKALNIGKNKAYELLKREEIKSFRIGRNHKIPKIWVINYINNTTTTIEYGNRLLVDGKELRNDR
jgi:excisionase family DNA binding protein